MSEQVDSVINDFEMNDRITVLLGAGAMVDATGVSTKSLTEKVIESCWNFEIFQKICEILAKMKTTDQVADFSENLEAQFIICNPLHGRLLTYFNCYTKMFSNKNEDEDIKKISRELANFMNFEEIFHVIEILASYFESPNRNKHNYIGKVFPVPYEMLNIENPEKELIKVGFKFIDTINNEIYKYDRETNDDNDKWIQFKKFFNDIQSNGKFILDIFNLNYDTWIEESLGICNYNDGYVDDNSFNDRKVFDVEECLKLDKRHTVSHLHGQIYFAPQHRRMRSDGKVIPPYNLWGDRTLYKYNEKNNIKTGKRGIEGTTQAGYSILETNIITGLMKPDKLLLSPFDIYYHRFANSLMTNPNLLVIGYGGSDLHINSLLNNYCRRHNRHRKIVVVNFITDAEMQDIIEQNVTQSNDVILLTSILFGEDAWWGNEPKHDYESKDKTSHFYRGKFKDIMSEKTSEIIKHFT